MEKMNALYGDLKTKGLNFSAHAKGRMKSRGIDFGKEMMDKLSGAVENASKKGARESLVLMKDLAFIVNVKNKTVVTAMEGGQTKEGIFTNIDSAVIV